MDRRLEHVRLLAIFHFVFAGLVFLGSLVPVFWVAIASLWWPELASDPDAAPALATGALGAALVGFVVLLAWIWAAVVACAGRSLMTRRRHTFCLVVAGLMCLCPPLGTVLGVVTLIMLNREEIRELFADA